jgi:hypothetical protein
VFLLKKMWDRYAMTRKPKSEQPTAVIKTPLRTKAGVGPKASEPTKPIAGRRGGARGVARSKRAKPAADAATDTPLPTQGAPLPHELLLAIARGERVGAHDPTFAERLSAAKASARYFAPERKADEGDRAIARDIKRARRTLAAKLARLSPGGGGGEDKEKSAPETNRRDGDK